MSDKSNPQVKIGLYVIGETLGTGTFGKVKGERIGESTLRFALTYHFTTNRT